LTTSDDNEKCIRFFKFMKKLEWIGGFGCIFFYKT